MSCLFYNVAFLVVVNKIAILESFHLKVSIIFRYLKVKIYAKQWKIETLRTTHNES